MRFNFTLISIFLFASAVLADLSPEHHSSQFLNVVEKRATNISNNAGAVLDSTALNSSSTFQTVIGTFEVPFIWGPDGAEVGIMVGLDNGPDTYCGVAFRAGLICTVTSTWPSCKFTTPWSLNSKILTDLKVSSGDLVRVTLAVSNRTTGNATFEVFSIDVDEDDAQATVPFDSEQPFCQKSAWWLLEKIDGHDLAQFDTVDIEAKACDQHNSCLDARGSSLYDITSEDGQPLAVVETSWDLVEVIDKPPPV